MQFESNLHESRTARRVMDSQSKIDSDEEMLLFFEDAGSEHESRYNNKRARSLRALDFVSSRFRLTRKTQCDEA